MCCPPPQARACLIYSKVQNNQFFDRVIHAYFKDAAVRILRSLKRQSRTVRREKTDFQTMDSFVTTIESKLIPFRLMKRRVPPIWFRLPKFRSADRPIRAKPCNYEETIEIVFMLR